MGWSAGSWVAGGGGNDIYFLLTDHPILQGLSAALSKYLNKMAQRTLQKDLLQCRSHQRFIDFRACRSRSNCYYYYYFMFIIAVVSRTIQPEEALGQP